MDEAEIQEAQFVGRYGIQTLDVGRVFDHGLWLIRDNAKLLAVTALVFPFPLALIRSALIVYAQRAIENVETVDDPTFFVVVWAALFAGSVFMFVVELPFSYAAFTHIFTRSYLGHSPSFRETIRTAFSLYFPVTGLMILRGIATTLGACLLFVGSFIAAVVFAIAVTSFVIERRGVVNALERSIRLSWPNFFQVLLVILAMGVVTGQAGFIGLLQFKPWLFISVSAVFSAFSYILESSVCTALYFSLRSKQEAYDLELMAEVIDTSAAAPVAL